MKPDTIPVRFRGRVSRAAYRAAQPSTLKAIMRTCDSKVLRQMAYGCWVNRRISLTRQTATGKVRS